MTIEENKLFNSLLQDIIKINLSAVFLRIVDEWSDTSMVDITVKVPKLLIDAMNIAMKNLRVEELCGASVAYHCHRFDLEMPKEFMFPAMPKTIDPKKAVEKFIDNNIIKLLESLPSETLDSKKFNDTCDMMGATIMRLGELRKNGSGDQTQH